MEESNEVRVKNEPICYHQSISQTSEPIDSVMLKSKPQIEVKAEEKFSATEEFQSIQTTSIAFLNEETTLETTISDKPINKKTNKQEKSK